eukprot:gene1348-1429_t
MAFNERWLHSIQRICQTTVNQRIPIIPSMSMNLHLKKDRKHAAVLIPLCNRNNIASLIFTKRTDRVGTHKGQVSYPGGHLDINETPIDAAIRETYEELGSKIGNITILGVCQTIPAITGTLVTPVIGYLDSDIGDFEQFEPNEDEVSVLFSRPIDQLNSDSYRSYEMLQRGGVEFKAPSFGEKDDDCRIWGLTAIITDSVLNNVIIPTQKELEQYQQN